MTKVTHTIRENQNIFDAIIEKAGSLAGGIKALVSGSDEINWQPDPLSEVSFLESELEVDEVVLEIYRRKNIKPANKEFLAGTIGAGDFDDDFTFDDGNDGGGFGSGLDGVGYWRIGVDFKVSSSQLPNGIGGLEIENDFVVAADPIIDDLIPT